jgi:hypothetical protein
MSARRFFGQRGWLLGLAASLGMLVHCTSDRPPPRTLDGLAAMLGRASNTVVDAKDIAWEPSPGFLIETFVGRRVLFLGAPKQGEPRDLYRAHVRITIDGKPIRVTQHRNLTQTPIGDDAALEARGSRAVFATVAYGRIQGISVLELGGVRAEDRPDSAFHRLLQSITAYQETGNLAGLGRTDIVLDVPARQAKLRLDDSSLLVDLGDAGRTLAFDLSRRVVRGAEGGQAYAARAIVQRQHEKPLVLWGVDTVRAEIGPEPIAWLEDKVFGARDSVKRTSYALFTQSAGSNRLKSGSDTIATPILGASKLHDSADSWPPPPVPSLWEQPEPGEGEWEPVTHPFLERLPGADEGQGKPPAYFYQTVIRPDPKRPYSHVQLIAMDMRQLELGMEAGFEDPKPLTGPPGGGRLPREQSVTDRIVATFNGAFKTTHGKYGMMVNGRVLLPPVPGGATITVTDDRRVGLGSWPQSEAIPDDLVSFRQNLDPLVEDGVANPTGRFIWGWQLSGKSVLTQRTALCVTPGGHLYYAFATEIDGPTLGKALRQAGCNYGVHLDMNPGHCGFVYTDILDLRGKQFTLKKAHAEMSLPPDKFVRWSAKDFFYVMVRDPVPHDPSGIQWKPDGGAQPPPAWMPGIFAGKLSIGSLEVEIESFEHGRVDWRVRAGLQEPSVVGAPPTKLDLAGDDKHRVVAAIGLGHTTEATRYGIAFDGKSSLELRAGYATLVIGRGGPLRILPPGRQPQIGPKDEAVQLPLLAEDTKLTSYALTRGPMRLRGAMCTTDGGRVLIARARHDSSDGLASALLRIGCKRVVELDRGSQHPAFMHRTGSPTPPLASYETSVLYAIGRPMLPYAFRWKAEGAIPSRRPTGMDFSPEGKLKPTTAPSDSTDSTGSTDRSP